MAREIVFRLEKSNPQPSMMKYDKFREEAYATIFYPPHFGIPSEDVIFDPRETKLVGGEQVENKSKGKPTRIRLARGESSIFVDEQSEDAQNRRIKLAFQNGILEVDPLAEPTKLEYIRLTNINKNPFWQGRSGTEKFEQKRMQGRKVVFYEVNYKEIAESYIEDLETEADALYIGKQMEFDEVRKFSRIMGLTTSEDYTPAEIRHTFLNKVKQDPEFFLELIENEEDVEMRDLILEAIDKETIEVKGNSISWVQGGTIFSATRGKDVLDSFQKWLEYDEDGREIHAELQKMVLDGVDSEEAVAKARKRKNADTRKKMVELAFDAKIIKWNPKTMSFFLDEDNLGKSKAKITENVANDDILFSKIELALENIEDTAEE